MVSTTDDRGVFSFPDLSDGVWTIDVEALGFAKLSREVGIAPDAPAPAFELKFLSEEALLAALEPAAPPAKVTVPAAESPRTTETRPAPKEPLPSLSQRGGFRRAAVTQSADSAAFSTEGAIKTEEAADLSQSTNNSFLVQGSMSTPRSACPSRTIGADLPEAGLAAAPT